MGQVDLWSAILAAAAVSAISFEMRRETMPSWWLFATPVLAVACLMALPARPLSPYVGAACLVMGTVGGGVRGLQARLKADHVWRLVRLGPHYDGIAIALLLAVAVGANLEPVVKAVSTMSNPIAAAGVLAIGYLIGRSVAMVARLRLTPHDDMRPVPGERR